MAGKRIVDWDGAARLMPGEYARDPNGRWFACLPNWLLANLSGHDVTEHEDGTITVAPSILTRGAEGEWHGFLEHGAWRSV